MSDNPIKRPVLTKTLQLCNFHLNVFLELLYVLQTTKIGLSSVRYIPQVPPQEAEP